MHQESSRGVGRVEGASLKTMVGAGRTSSGPDSRFTRRRHRLRVGLSQLLFIAVGLVADDEFNSDQYAGTGGGGRETETHDPGQERAAGGISVV